MDAVAVEVVITQVTAMLVSPWRGPLSVCPHVSMQATPGGRYWVAMSSTISRDLSHTLLAGISYIGSLQAQRAAQTRWEQLVEHEQGVIAHAPKVSVVRRSLLCSMYLTL